MNMKHGLYFLTTSWERCSAVECLFAMYKVLGSISSIGKKKLEGYIIYRRVVLKLQFGNKISKAVDLNNSLQQM